MESSEGVFKVGSKLRYIVMDIVLVSSSLAALDGQNFAFPGPCGGDVRRGL